MSHQIIKQPDGKLAIFSDGVNDWLVWNYSPDEIAEYYAERARKDTFDRALETALAVKDGRAREKYYQFTMTYAEACETAGHPPEEVAK